MTTLTAGSSATYAYVVSIPDVYQLWNLFKNDFWARFIWATAGICQSLLANPGSTAATDVARRAAVRQRNIDYNAALASVCAEFVRCRFDGNVVFNTPFTTADVSGDYFHPSTAGQAKLAAVSWAAGYTWGSAPPPPPPPNEDPVAAFGVTCVDLSCSFTDSSTDDGHIVAWSWTFGDGGASTAQNPTHTYASGGTYSVTLTVTDDVGESGASTTGVTVSAPPMTVGTLTGSATVSRNTWTATVSIRVVDGTGAGVPNATVTGTWTAGAPDTCVTGADGRCPPVTSDSLNRRKISSVTFTVTDVTQASHSYVPSLTSVTITP
jgi:PKD repeat protein